MQLLLLLLFAIIIICNYYYYLQLLLLFAIIIPLISLFQVREDLQEKQKRERERDNEVHIQNGKEEKENGEKEIQESESTTKKIDHKSIFDGDLSISDIFEEKKKVFLVQGSFSTSKIIKYKSVPQSDHSHRKREAIAQ